VKLTPAQFAFVRALIEDIQNYKTLSTFTLRRLIVENNDYKELLNEIEQLRQTIGDNFFNPVREKISRIHEEIIVAVENRNIK